MDEQPPAPEFTEDELSKMPPDDLRRLAEEARRGQPFEPIEDPDSENEHGYDIPLPEDPEGNDTHPVEYVFAVYYDREAGAIAVSALDKVVIQDQEGGKIRLVPERQASADDMWRGAAEVCKDIESAQTSSQVAQTMMQMSQAAQQQMAVQRQQQQQAEKEAQRIQEAARRR